MILRFLRISKRFYNPPTKKSWSKQHPDFRTRRPLVEPYNLGRLHPEKEWWKLPKKGLSPSTFMGFPDVAHLEKRGGSLYANLMDGNTLSMVIYRAIQHDVKDAQIWHSLTRQALKLAMSLDPYVVSLLFLYLSRSNWYDHQFIVTFTGRILATLSEFTIVECANVLMAMENTKFFHEKTQKHVIQHAESLCLSDIRSITVDDALKLLAVIKQDMMGVDNILVALGEIVEVSDISTTDEMVLIQSMEALCNIRDRVDRLCVTRIFDELCNRLEADKICNHARNIAILQTMACFHYRRPMAIELIQQRLHNNVHTANTLEMCQYMYFSTVTDRCLPSDDVYSNLSIRCVRQRWSICVMYLLPMQMHSRI
ncbi:hypothetical protein BBOV_III010210 [Babesia bovis T2Bo]|uniref:hypothetical protein n=1 Tax=Babesia bovis T2Bo TaxID=484906 RepID=UPI001C366AAD|nr:hypothetical protein BBOV_III010210 [Babesia bovis T2Bo]EDO08577.2 hypothetical protein BBOV_III010210 [Babesia bovis T2Bo]